MSKNICTVLEQMSFKQTKYVIESWYKCQEEKHVTWQCEWGTYKSESMMSLQGSDLKQ